MNRYRAAAFGAALLLLAGCRHPDYFPLKPGQEREFTVRSFRLEDGDTFDLASYTARLSVADRAADPTLGAYWVMRLDGYPPLPGRYRLQWRRNRLVLLPSEEDGTGVGEPVTVLSLPLAAGRIWYGNDARDESFEILDYCTVTVPAGTFNRCFRIAMRSPAVDWVLQFWLAPDVGIVKWERRSTRESGGPARARVETAELARPVTHPAR